MPEQDLQEQIDQLRERIYRLSSRFIMLCLMMSCTSLSMVILLLIMWL